MLDITLLDGAEEETLSFVNRKAPSFTFTPLLVSFTHHSHSQQDNTLPNGTPAP